jgi:nucleotide-binding universal stress UspA family protein
MAFHQQDKEAPMMYQKVLVPLDGSMLAECALPHIKKMAKQGFIQEITLLHVIDIHPNAFAEGLDVGAIQNAELDSSRAYLDGLQSRYGKEGITVKTEILKGLASQMIAEYANKNDVNLIVIATHGYTGMKRLMFGSVALKVLHEAKAPVLLIKPEPGMV